MNKQKIVSTEENTVIEASELQCERCGVALELKKTYFSYLGHAFHTDLPRCPVCGQVYIDEELVKGRMSRVERELEEK